MQMHFAISFKKTPPKFRIVELDNGYRYFKYAVQEIDAIGNWFYVGPKDSDKASCRKYIRRRMRKNDFVRVVEKY